MKKLKLVIGLVIVIVLGCWVASRWHTWFVEEDEEAYVVSSSPVHVLLTFGDAQPLSRNVSWQADSVLRPSWLELVCLADSDTIRVEAQGELFRSRGGQAAYYVARLRDLRLAQVMPIVPLLARRLLPGISFIRSQAQKTRWSSCM